MVYPDGSEAHYAYDAAGRLAGVTDAGGNALAAYAYDHDGRMATHTVGGTLATGAYRYNTRDWVTGIDYPGRFTLSQAYDDFGRVTRVGEAAADFANLDKVVEETMSLSQVMTNLCYLTVLNLPLSFTSYILLYVIHN